MKINDAQATICSYLVPRIDVSAHHVAANLRLPYQSVLKRLLYMETKSLVAKTNEPGVGRGNTTWNLTYAGFVVLNNHLAARARLATA